MGPLEPEGCAQKFRVVAGSDDASLLHYQLLRTVAAAIATVTCGRHCVEGTSVAQQHSCVCSRETAAGPAAPCLLLLLWWWWLCVCVCVFRLPTTLVSRVCVWRVPPPQCNKPQPPSCAPVCFAGPAAQAGCMQHRLGVCDLRKNLSPCMFLTLCTAPHGDCDTRGYVLIEGLLLPDGGVWLWQVRVHTGTP